MNNSQFGSAALNRGLPWGAILNVAAALLYGVSPIDLIPDFIVVLGWLDDAIAIPLFLFFAVLMCRRWKKSGRLQSANATVESTARPPVNR